MGYRTTRRQMKAMGGDHTKIKGHEFVSVGNRRWCLGCNLFQQRDPPGNKPFPTPRNECARNTPFAHEKDRAEALDSIGWFG